MVEKTALVSFKMLLAIILSLALGGCANKDQIDTDEPSFSDATSEQTATPTTDVGQVVADAIYATQTAVALLPRTPMPTETPNLHPFRLEQVGQMGGAANFLALNGDMVYLQVGTRLVTVDVSTPAAPTIIGQSEVIPAGIEAVGTYENHAAVGDGDGQIWLFETPSDGDPILVRTFSEDDPDRPDVNFRGTSAVESGYGFDVHEEFWAGDAIFLYVTQDGEIVETALAPLPEATIASTYNLVVRDRYAYTAIRSGLRIFDLGTAPEKEIIFPEDGTFILRWKVAGELVTNVGTLTSGWYTPSLCVIGDYLKTSQRYWNLDDPTNPVQVSQPDNPIPHCNSFPISSGWINSYHAQDGTYQFLDTRDEANPIIREIPLGVQGRGDILATNDDLLLFVSSDMSNNETRKSTLLIFDISDPTKPILASQYETGWLHQPLSPVQLIGSYAYINIANDGSRHIMLDISDPANPREVEPPNSTFFDAGTILIQGSLVYVAIENRLEIYAIDDLSTPINILEMPTTFTMWISNGRLLISSDTVLTVLDLTDPTAPHVMATGNIPMIYQAAAYGDYIYVHQMEWGVGIYKLIGN